jgi:hypothetical protein
VDAWQRFLLERWSGTQDLTNGGAVPTEPVGTA